VRRLPPYVFEQVNKLKAKARAAGADIIDLGMGQPGPRHAKHVVDKLIETVGKPRTNRYSASRASRPAPRPGGLLRAAIRGETRSGNPDRRHARLEGRLRHMAQAITAPGDVVLTPNPSYPIHAFGFLIAGGSFGPFRPSRRRTISSRSSGR